MQRPHPFPTGKPRRIQYKPRPPVLSCDCGYSGEAAPGTECPECDKPLYPRRGA